MTDLMQTGDNYLGKIVEHMPDAFAYHKLTFNSENFVTGYVFITVNRAFEEMTGLSALNIIGKNITDVMPEIKNSEFDWIKTYSEVAISGNTKSFKEYSAPLNKWFEVVAFSDRKDYFCTVFREITSDINEKQALESIVEVSGECFKNYETGIVFDKIASSALDISGALAVGFNMYDKEGRNFTTVSLVGKGMTPDSIKEITGFDVSGKVWKHDKRREKLIAGNEITEFSDLYYLVGNIIPKEKIGLLEEKYLTGKVYVLKIVKSDIMFGDFTIIMSQGDELQNREYLKILSRLTGQYLERKFSNDELVAKKEELEGFFSVNLDLLCIADLEGNFIRINKAWSEVLGYSTEEILERKFFDFIHPDDMETTFETISKLKNREKVINFVNRYRAKDGSYRFIEWRSNPGEKYVYAAARDITDKINSQRMLLDEHNKMMTIFDNMEAVVYVVDMDTYEILYINQHGISELGNLKGKICWKYVHPENEGVCKFCPIDELKKNDGLKNFKNHREYFNRVSNKWYQCTDSIIKWIDGKNVKLTVSLDITSRVLLEQERFLEQEKFKTTLLSVGDAVIATDENGNITVMNKVAEQLCEWTQEEAYGKPLDEIFKIIHERTKKPCENPAKQVLLTGETIELANHTALVTKSGKLIPIEDSAAPIKGLNGVVIGVVIVFRDYTTKREQLQKVEFLSFNDHLTGLYNRRFLENSLKKLDKERNYPLTITVIDVNGLKLTNDAYGHEMGDKLLVEVARLLKNSCGKKDIIARTGGDEFVILQPKTDSSKADYFKQKIRSMASKVKLDSIIVSLAIGYDTKTDLSQDIYEIMRQADNRMYKNKLRSGKYMRSKTIEAVLQNINNKYDNEQIHTEKVSQYCAAIGRAMGLNEIQIDELKTVGVLHDIGKTVISPEILNKKEKLTQNEISEIRRHTIIGYNILKGVEEYSKYADAVLYHHERIDGKGYPSGIKGREIPLYSRIVAVADAYEAMTSKRSYQSAKTKKEAVEELIRCSGTQFDEEIVKAFVEKVL